MLINDPSRLSSVHAKLSDAMMSLADAVSACERDEIAELADVARLLTAAQQRLTSISAAVKAKDLLK